MGYLGRVFAHSKPAKGIRAPRFHCRATEFGYMEIEAQTKGGISIDDITPQIREFVKAKGIRQGSVNVISKHTTTAIMINEFEPRLVEDVRRWLHRLAPPHEMYMHNDIERREAPDGWPGGRDAWIQQEPINAHSHLMSILVGNSETVPLVDGELMLGTWQSVLLLDFDGPRVRKVGVQVMGQT